MARNPAAHQRQLSSVFAPLNDATRVQQVMERIVSGISMGVLIDGDRLPSEAEMAASMGASVMTCRDALSQLRGMGLVSTRRGREGGTFLTLPVGGRRQLMQEKLAALSRVQLRDLGIHYAAILAAAAELAALGADEEELDILQSLLDDQPSAVQLPGSKVSNFLLETAALSQSALLTREYVRLHSGFGAMLSLAHENTDFDLQGLDRCTELLAALRAADQQASRIAVTSYVRAAVSWLVDYQASLNPSSRPPATKGLT
ncbi:FadR/GntR family transcriptional regulator [Glutamicibacter arilaitensis]|uniref:FadR/GntR family transcriptional regulator n=1 Tax=Glutamicibacter arilaitensis TaxID=256701 RepID=UPI003A954BD7